MSKRSFYAKIDLWGTGTADASALTTGKYMFLDSGGTTQALQVIEFYLGGLATSSAPILMLWGRASTAAATPTTLVTPNSDGPLNNYAAAVTTVPVACVAAGTQPQRATAVTAAKLNLSFNAFGGVVRWVAAPGEEWWIMGNGANVSSVLSTFTGSTDAPISASIVYELM